MRRNLLFVIFAIFAGTAGAVQQGIQTGGPIADKRGFNIKVNDTRRPWPK